MKTSEFDYNLPKALIAQTPLAQRDSSRLMVLDRANGRLHHQKFSDIFDQRKTSLGYSWHPTVLLTRISHLSSA